MPIKVEKYTGTKTYMFPNGELATPEVVHGQFPASAAFGHIVETDEAGEVMFAFQNLAAVRSQLGIDPALSEAEAIAAIEVARNTVPVAEPTPEERIAAALEFQNLMNM
jgi:hypothetical protein